MTAAESAGRRPDVPALTGLRFLAAFSVLLAHGLAATVANNEPPRRRRSLAHAILRVRHDAVLRAQRLCDPLQLRRPGDRRAAGAASPPSSGRASLASIRSFC